MWKLTRRGLWSHKRRLISTSLAVVLGVAFLTATLTLGDTMRGGIDQLLEHGNAETDVIVRNATKYGSDDMVERGRLDGGLVAELAQLDGVAVAAPSIEGFAQIVGSDGDPIGGNGPPTLAGNWIDDPRLNPYQVVEGRAPAAAGEVVIDRRSARLGELEVGDHTTLRTPDPLDVEIVGIAKFGSVDGVAGASFVAFTNDQARDVLVGGADEVSSILLMGDDGISPEQLRSTVASALPSEAEALTGDEIIAETQDDIEADFLGFFETFLLMFAGVALLVATFSIHNTFSILVAQRTRESALVRAIGASRGQVLRSICAEGLAVGVVASGIGLGAGIGLGYGLRALIESFGVELPNAGLVVTTSTIVAALVVGIVVTFLASVTPAIKGSRVAPLAALRENAIDRSGASKWRAAFGALALGGGIALTITAVTNSRRRAGPSRARSAGDPGRRRCARPRRRPSRVGAAGIAAGGVPWVGPTRPPQRDAQPAPHIGQRVGAHGRHRCGGAVHHRRRLDQGVGRRCRGAVVLRRPRDRRRVVQWRRPQPDSSATSWRRSRRWPTRRR